MALKDLLLHVDESEHSVASLAAALELASAQDATLTGLYTLAGLEPLAVAFGRDSSTYRDRLAKARDGAAEPERWMRGESARRRVPSEWLISEGDPGVSMAMASRFYDLAITYRHAPALTVGWNVAEEVLMSGSRPCLVLPPGWDKATGSRVLLAWNGSRESSRALAAALPVLRKASSVSVLIGPSRDPFRAVVRPPKLDLGRHLERHGVKAEIASLDIRDESAGGAILREAYAREADLVVMGAYGRSWTSEWILGGTTRRVLREADVPLLMSC